MKQITINGQDFNLELNKETIISLNIGDKINVNGLLKDYQPYYDMENLILINPETGQKIIIQNVNNVFENNNDLLDFDLNKLTDIYSNSIPEDPNDEDPTPQVDKEVEVSYVNVNNTLYEKVTIPTIALEVGTETSVLNEELIESEGLILIEEQWYKPTIVEKEETFTDYRTEIIRIETPYEPYNSIGIEYNNLNNYGDTIGNISFGHLVNDISIQIKSFKLDFDEGIINFYKEGELVNSSYIDEYYDSKDNIETMLNIKTDFDYDTLSITHNGEAQGVGQQSGEFKIGGIIENNVFDTIITEEEIEVPFENTRIVEVEENILYEGDVYQTIIETNIEYVEDPSFDKTTLIEEGGEWYQPIENTYLKAILSGGDEEEYFNLDNLIDNVEEIELSNNINISLDDLLTSDKYYGENLEIKIVTNEGEEVV
jgi:hypothetical protein